MFSFVQKERRKDMFLQEHGCRKSTWIGGLQSIAQKMLLQFDFKKMTKSFYFSP